MIRDAEIELPDAVLPEIEFGYYAARVRADFERVGLDRADPFPQGAKELWRWRRRQGLSDFPKPRRRRVGERASDTSALRDIFGKSTRFSRVCLQLRRMAGAGELNGGEENLGELVVARGDGPEMFELDLDLMLERRGRIATLLGQMALHRDARLHGRHGGVQ